MRNRKFLGLTAGAVTVAGLAAAVIPAASASAAAGGLTVCSRGGYLSYVDIPAYGASSFVANPDHCVTTWFGGNTNVQIYVYDVNSGQEIGSTIYNGSVGETIVTIDGPSFYAYNGTT